MDRSTGSLQVMKLQIINNPTCDNSITFHKTFEENLFPMLAIYRNILAI